LAIGMSLKGDKIISRNKFNNALVLGGTGMLAEASAYIAGISSIISLGARNPEPLAGQLDAVPLVLDWTDHEATLRLLQNGSKYDLIVSWVHREGLWLNAHLENLLVQRGRFIGVSGSGGAGVRQNVKLPSRSATGILRQKVILGWINEANGRRWLSHSQISAGVIRAVQNSQLVTSIVGVVK